MAVGLPVLMSHNDAGRPAEAKVYKWSFGNADITSKLRREETSATSSASRALMRAS